MPASAVLTTAAAAANLDSSVAVLRAVFNDGVGFKYGAVTKFVRQYGVDPSYATVEIEANTVEEARALAEQRKFDPLTHQHSEMVDWHVTEARLLK